VTPFLQVFPKADDFAVPGEAAYDSVDCGEKAFIEEAMRLFIEIHKREIYSELTSCEQDKKKLKALAKKTSAAHPDLILNTCPSATVDVKKDTCRRVVEIAHPEKLEECLQDVKCADGLLKNNHITLTDSVYSSLGTSDGVTTQMLHEQLMCETGNVDKISDWGFFAPSDHIFPPKKNAEDMTAHEISAERVGPRCCSCTDAGPSKIGLAAQDDDEDGLYDGISLTTEAFHIAHYVTT
jgi:hypothetical protein